MEEETIKIIEPTQDVFDKAEYYIGLVKEVLPEAKVTLIGSLAIPICIKNEIDILVELKKGEQIETAQEKVRDAYPDVFGVGPIDNGEGFSRSKKKHGLICELHFLHDGDNRIKEYLDQVERFRSDPELAQQYSKLKKSLDGVTSSIYKVEKKKFFEANNI